MTNMLSIGRALSLVLLDSWSMAACAADLGDDAARDEAANLGTLSLPLSAKLGDTTYRYKGWFELRTYPGSSYIMTIIGSDEDDVWTAQLNPGTYYLAARGDGVEVVSGPDTGAEARIVQSDQKLVIAEGETTTMVYRFVVDGEEIPLTRGQVDIRIEVAAAKQPGAYCTVTEECLKDLVCHDFHEPLFKRCAQVCEADADCTLGGSCREGGCY